MADEYARKEAVLNAIHSGDIDMGMVTPKEHHLLQELSAKIDKKIQGVPAVDVRSVIFCENCDNWNEWDHAGRKSLGNFRCSCAYWSVEDGPVFFTAPTDFCSYAEPREVDDG